MAFSHQIEQRKRFSGTSLLVPYKLILTHKYHASGTAENALLLPFSTPT